MFSVAKDLQFFWVLPTATIVSLLIGPLIAEKVPRMRFLFFWVLVGVISSLLPVFLSKFGEHGTAVSLALWGFSFGIGAPSALALMPALTRVEERGRVGGVIFFVTFAILPLFVLTIGNLDISSSSLPLAVWRGLALLLLFSLKVDLGATLKPVSYTSIFPRREFLLFFAPWLIFGLVHQLEYPVIEQSFGTNYMWTLTIVESVVGSLFCFIGGWSMDFWGRKWTILIGLMLLGLGFALLSFFPLALVVQAFYIGADGIAWGIFTVAFGLVIWGDMANHQQAEKFYGLGSIPTPLALLAAGLASPWLKTLDASKAFPLASFFLFLAVIPIFFAPELLPEKVVKERELRKYVEEAKKIAGRG